MNPVPYSNYLEAAALLVLLALPLIALAGAWRSRLLRRRGFAHPIALAATECTLLVVVLADLVITLVMPAQAGRSIDLNPLIGAEGTSAFRWLFLTNFVLLPMPLAAVAALRFNALAKVRNSLWLFGAVFLLVETAQYVRGGRVASVQDVLLATAGATLAASFVGTWARPLSAELSRIGPDSSMPPRLVSPVSRRRSVVTGVAVLGPLVWAASLPAPTTTALASPLQEDDSICGLPAGAWAIPETAPVGRWTRWHGRVLPRSAATFGPAHIEGEAARCFAHNPSGALLAAAWQLAPQTPDRSTLAGFRIDSANPGTVHVALLLDAPTGYQVASSVIRWTHGDWHTSATDERLLPVTRTRPPGYVVWPRSGPTG